MIENGQFGNQLFQFNFCIKIKKANEKIIFIGFDDLSKFIKENKNIFFLKKKNLISKLIIRTRILLINLIKKTRIIKIILEQEDQKIIFKKGLFNLITLINGHFEQERYIKKNINRYFKNTEIENNSKKILKKIKKNKEKIFFIHVRLKENLIGIVKDYPSAVPFSWYLKCRNILKKKNRNSEFIFISDDLKFLRNNLKKNEIFLQNSDPFINFYIMKNCDGGILSPSSFSWWASFLSKKNVFYAPRYWHGHRQKKNLPKNFKSKLLRYITVEKKEYLTQIRNEAKFYKVLPFK